MALCASIRRHDGRPAPRSVRFDVSQSRQSWQLVAFAEDARSARSNSMLDIILLAIGLGFFAIALAYVAGCERL
jgi:hypothetical protein